ncbi:uncharacterized protein LOC120359770 [Solenopsis invicta]|uniref:uncharacterized protein LOC120359770 n=1 Tax=Solenopsis invicta TaxID=13686 RepID=UPI00193E32DB|nr:uncharacterized protein LOC120359770 [Solenopsis invicta]
MRQKMDPKSRKIVFVGYDQLTDKIYQVFDPTKKDVERVFDVIIQNLSDENNQVLFPLPFDKQVEDFEEPPIEPSSSGSDEKEEKDDSEETIDKLYKEEVSSSDDYEEALDDTNEDLLKMRKRG